MQSHDGDPYGVPTGVVPRRRKPADPPGPANVGFGSLGSDPIAQVVDDYLLMERKARAWDALRERARDWAAVEVTLAEMDRLVHPAQDSSTR